MASTSERPQWLATAPENDLSEVQHVAVAFRIYDHGTHVGVIYRAEQGGPALLHLAWHHRLTSEHPDAGYGWVQPPIHPSRARSLAGLCRLIWKRFNETGVAYYAFRYAADAFDPTTGDALLGDSIHGLTCSTFVLAVFETFAIRLLDLDQWTSNPREDDRVAQERLLELLRRTGAERAHCEAVEQEIGCVRFRPEEVAGGSSASPLPASFAYAERAGVELIAALMQRNKNP